MSDFDTSEFAFSLNPKYEALKNRWHPYLLNKAHLVKVEWDRNAFKHDKSQHVTSVELKGVFVEMLTNTKLNGKNLMLPKVYMNSKFKWITVLGKKVNQFEEPLLQNVIFFPSKHLCRKNDVTSRFQWLVDCFFRNITFREKKWLITK